MKKRIPRILLAAGASGSGKTLLTCGLLQVLVNRGIKTVSFKCGPDYIDPMFHTQVIGTKSRNLDTFFTGEEITRYLLAKNSADCEIAVMEGVMGFYDGVAGITTRASAYDLARVTDTPVILIVNSKGMSVSLAAYIKGFMEYKRDSHIKGVIFNQMSAFYHTVLYLWHIAQHFNTKLFFYQLFHSGIKHGRHLIKNHAFYMAVLFIFHKSFYVSSK